MKKNKHTVIYGGRNMGKTALHQSIQHINATPEFLNDDENIKLINKMVENVLTCDHTSKPTSTYRLAQTTTRKRYYKCFVCGDEYEE